MLLTKIIFLLLIVICSLFYVLYIWDFSLVLLIVVCAIPVIMFLMLFLTKGKISAEFKIKNSAAVKNEVFDVQLNVTNKSFFPVGKAEAVIEYYNVFNNQINEINIHFPIQGRNSHCLTFQLSSKFCGIVKIKCAYITIFDPLRIFKFRICRNISDTVSILPEGHDISAIVTSTDRENDESEIFSEYKAGDDPSEVFDLRGYNYGDKLNRVHWKLSSKKDEWIIREFSLPVDSPTVVFLNLHCPEDSEYTLPLFDTLLESFVSISRFMLENERIHKIIYYNAMEKQFEVRVIDNTESLSAAVIRIVNSVRDDLLCEKPEAYFSDNQPSELASFTYVTADSNERILSFIDEKVDSEIKNAVIAVKSENELSVSDRSFESLCINPVFIGRVASSIQDIEL